MKPKAILAAVLLLFVLASVAFLIAKEMRRGRAPGAEQTGAPQAGDGIVAYYFYAPPRCYSCTTIEAYAREAVEGGFTDDIKAGRLEWRTVNIAEPGNQHFVSDFRLYTKSVVLAELRDGETVRWKNLEKVWELIPDKSAFLEYVGGEVRSFLEGAPG